MPAYNLYCLAKTGRVETVFLIDADTDEAAIAEAQTIVQRLDRELWSKGRLVARIPAARTQA